MSLHEFFKTLGVGVEASGVSKNYRTAAEEVHALKNVNWQLEAGKRLAIIGPSGCGKTTLLNLLGGVDRPSEGTVIIGDEDLTQASERSLEKHRLLKVGFVFQFFNLIPTLTATENIELPMMVAGVGEAERQSRTHSLLEMMGLAHKAGKRPEEMSGGEQQRVALALALANDPALLLADEPTGNLDTETGKTVVQLLHSLSAEYGKTVIMVSHDPKAVAMFPEVISMRDGQFEDAPTKAGP